jgi:hypothetical protein
MGIGAVVITKESNKGLNYFSVIYNVGYKDIYE